MKVDSPNQLEMMRLWQKKGQKHILKAKMVKLFKDEISIFPPEWQYIFLDDMITTFQNRLVTLSRIYAEYKLQDYDSHFHKAKELMKKLVPIRIELDKGSRIVIDGELVAEKNNKGKIILYEVSNNANSK